MLSVKEYLSLIGIIRPHRKIDDGTLAGTGMADQGNRFPSSRFYIDIIEHIVPAVIGKADISELDGAGKFSEFPVILFLRPGIDQIKHLHCGNPRLFKDVQLKDDVVERIEKSSDKVQQILHRADRERQCIIEEFGCEDVHHDGKYQRLEARQKVFTGCTLEIDQ